MRILVIEDEPKTANFVKKGLREAGFVVDVALDGFDGLHLALELGFDLIILDLMLPGMDGWQVLTRLRQEGRSAAVLILTARDAVHERVRGFELGADDYLVKPFAFSELLDREALSPIGGEGRCGRNVFYRSSSLSTLAACARRLKSLAGRTFFSPGKGTVNPVASYQL